MQLSIKSPDLANLEQTLNQRFGRSAVKAFMRSTANEAVEEATESTVTHLANTLKIPSSLARSHIYYRSKSDGNSMAVVAFSPSRTIPIKKLDPIQTKVGVKWKFAGRTIHRTGAFIWQGNVYARRKNNRSQIGRVRGHTVGWDDGWQNEITNIITRRFYANFDRWMNEHVR